MNFYIRQGATEPVLKMKLIDDGKNDISSFNDLLENSKITFEMYDEKTGSAVILDGQCQLTNRVKKYNYTTDEYYILYHFTESQTSEIGVFDGKFIIQFLDTSLTPTNKLIVPIKEKLRISIL